MQQNFRAKDAELVLQAPLGSQFALVPTELIMGSPGGISGCTFVLLMRQPSRWVIVPAGILFGVLERLSSPGAPLAYWVAAGVRGSPDNCRRSRRAV